ncbi:hypothetical protein PHAVU_003G225300 [Phaseolus vulgaris]|uniref:Uncharacterized protein n=1 Tax=Phaseolus vulgaris TaxID=3885 RepID=V7CC53_PHAVU|nr:hypothetical protein PHAVU_003G225300g [Phaseolus vulgaris]ESW27709.1 hypothetical protein PHAVU_003G225300g [Phaseolus vulgaris]
MPTKQVSYCSDKKVVVRLYVEKPRKKNSSSIQHQLHGPISMGCGRRAGLLSYSHLLRQSAKEALSAPSFSKWVTNNNLHPPTQITPSNMKRPTWLGSCSWKLLIPRFLRSWSKAKNKKNKKQNCGDFSGNGMKTICCYRS